MTRLEFIKEVDIKLKLIRNEQNLSQDKMADIIGISKKTLVQIEKQRSSLGWTGAVCVCTIFKDSEIIQMMFGDDANSIILSLAFDMYKNRFSKTMGGKLWWKDILINNNYKIQQNIVTNHYRILNDKNERICSSFDYEEIKKYFEEL